MDFAETSFVTTAFAPISEFFPIMTGPNIWAPEPMTTLSSRVGCLFIFLWSFELILGDIPPRVRYGK